MNSADNGAKYAIVAALAVALAAAGCRTVPAGREASFIAMGTLATVRVAGAEASRLDEYTAEARGIIASLEQSLSLYRSDSELARFNAAAGVAPLAVSGGLREVLALAVRYGAASGGAFDVTVGPLVRLWGFSGGAMPAAVPSAAAIAATRARIGYQHIRLDGTNAFLDVQGMVVDLGGIAKGYAVDRCWDALRRRGAQNVLVNFSGNMRCLGHPQPSRPWTLGVRDPFHPDALLGTLTLAPGMAVASSGNYERFVTLGGKPYGHIFDPRTGWPVEGMAGTTVLSPTAGEADALSTALFVLGRDAGARMLADLPGCEALFVPNRQPLELWVTPGFARVFTPAPELAARVFVLPPPRPDQPDGHRRP